jgi:C_GCAxxG_C_C family probable redox protein
MHVRMAPAGSPIRITLKLINKSSFLSVVFKKRDILRNIPLSIILPIMSRYDNAFTTMSNRHMNCAQTILSTYCDIFNLDRLLALQIAQGFGRGMGRGENNCGAVSGAYMVIGLARKLPATNPRENVDETYDLLQEFNRKFSEIHSSLICKDLVGFDISTPEGIAEARSKSIFTTRCPVFVRDAARILETLLKLS